MSHEFKAVNLWRATFKAWMGWYSMNFPPERQPIEKLKPKVNTKSRYLFVCWNPDSYRD